MLLALHGGLVSKTQNTLHSCNSDHTERDTMALSELETHRAHIRHELDLGYRFKGQSVEVFETRPAYDNPKELIELPLALLRTQPGVFDAGCGNQ